MKRNLAYAWGGVSFSPFCSGRIGWARHGRMCPDYESIIYYHDITEHELYKVYWTPPTAKHSTPSMPLPFTTLQKAQPGIPS